MATDWTYGLRNPYAKKDFYDGPDWTAPLSNPYAYEDYANRVRTQNRINKSNAYVNSQLAKARELEMQAAREQYAALQKQNQQLAAQQQRAIIAERQAARAEAERMAKQRESVFEAMGKKFASYGLDGKEILNVLKTVPGGLEGNPDVLLMKIRETDTWNKRFGAVMDARRKKGLPAISEEEVFYAEKAYRQALNSHDLPKGFYDSHEDFQHWLANDVSPEEISQRATLAEEAIQNKDPKFIKSFKEFYGIKRKDLVAYMLDRDRGVELLRQRVAAVEIGAEGKDQNLDSVGRKFSEKLVDKDITRQEARQAFNTTALQEQDLKRLAGIDDVKLTEKNIVNANLGLAPGKQKKIEKLKSQERARFTGSSGGTNMFGNDNSGAY